MDADPAPRGREEDAGGVDRDPGFALARRAARLGWESTAARLLGPANPDERLLWRELIEEREKAERDRFIAEQEVTATVMGVSRMQGQADVVEGLTRG